MTTQSVAVEQFLLLLDFCHTVEQELTRRTREVSSVTLQQAVVLCRIDMGGGRLTIGQLAEALGRAAHSVSGKIDALVRRGLVVRERERTRDRRQVWVSLTEDGRRRLDAYRNAADQLLHPVTDAMLTADQAQELIDFFRAYGAGDP